MRSWILAIWMGLGLATTATAQPEIGADQLMKQAHLNLYYAGDDGRAIVDMTLTNKKGKTRERQFVMLRLDLEDGGDQKYYTYFREPGDVRRTCFMVWKNPAEDDSRWIYVPALDLVRRVSGNDKASSFVGSDFSYEDVSGRHWSDDTHEWVERVDIEGRAADVIESRPNAEKDSFLRKRTWVDVEYALPVREEYYDHKDRLHRVFEALEVDEIDGVLTITTRKMTDVQSEHETLVVFTDVSYDVGLDEKLFTERFMKSPPAKWLK